MTTTALVTGATRGLGRETVRRLAELGWTVLLGARDEMRGKEVAAEIGGDVRAISLDVTSDESVAAAVAEVSEGHGRLDVLVNNAGIVGPLVGPLETGPDELLECYETNVFGPVRVTRAFLPLLRASVQPRVVMVSSGMGSITITSDPSRHESTIIHLPYTSSKNALNMITTQYAKALPGFQVNAADPGYTATDFNGHSGFQTVEQGTEAIVHLATLGAEGPTGTYVDAAGPVPW
jgi:NAD(P)-dependent dehydrogenase (short-subunit alcohol dehydrogenase family)